LRALILPDAGFLAREQALIARLEIGLADEGVRVVHAVPRSLGLAEASGGSSLYSTQAMYADDGLPLTLGLRAGALARLLERNAMSEGGRAAGRAALAGSRVIDVVHCFGVDSMKFGVAMARQCGSAALIELWTREHVDLAANIVTRSGLGGRVLCIAPDEKLLAVARGALGERRVELASWGVHVVDVIRRPKEDTDPVSVMLVLSGERAGRSALGVKQARAVMEGLAAFARSGREVLIFIEASAVAGYPISTWGAELGLSHAITIIPGLEARRDLLVQADVLLVAQSLGEHRTLLLDAMSAQMGVLALADPCVDAIDDAHGVRVLHDATPASWGEALKRWATDPEENAARARRSRSYVMEKRPGFSHSVAVVRAYARIADVNNELRLTPETQSPGGAA
jgi:hypothetical protein